VSLSGRQEKFLADLEDWRRRWLEQPVGSYKLRSQVPRPNGYTIFDVETTGTRHGEDRVVSVAASRCDADGEVIDRFYSLVNPVTKQISAEASAVNGITPEMLVDAPRFEQLADRLLDLLDGHVFTAFNAEFDLPMLQNEYRLLGRQFTPVATACLLQAYRVTEPDLEKHKLGDWAEVYGHEFNAHDASEDVRISELLLRDLLAKDIAPESVEFDEDLWVRKKVEADPESLTKPASAASIRFVFVMARQAGWVDEFNTVQSGKVRHLCRAVNGCELDDMTVMQQARLVDAFRLMLVRQRKRREAAEAKAAPEQANS
jgi:DNA polymerase III epsilon subunit family exonuclease